MLSKNAHSKKNLHPLRKVNWKPFVATVKWGLVMENTKVIYQLSSIYKRTNI